MVWVCAYAIWHFHAVWVVCHGGYLPTIVKTRLIYKLRVSLQIQVLCPLPPGHHHLLFIHRRPWQPWGLLYSRGFNGTVPRCYIQQPLEQLDHELYWQRSSKNWYVFDHQYRNWLCDGWFIAVRYWACAQLEGQKVSGRGLVCWERQYLLCNCWDWCIGCSFDLH